MLHGAVFAIVAESDDQLVEEAELGRVASPQMLSMKLFLEYGEHLLENVLFYSKQLLIFALFEPGNSFMVIHRQESQKLKGAVLD